MDTKKIVKELKYICGNIDIGWYSNAKKQMLCLCEQLEKDAVKEDKRAEPDLRNAVSLLRDLADLQNGAPLVRYEKEWQQTMDNVYNFLEIHEKNTTKTN